MSSTHYTAFSKSDVFDYVSELTSFEKVLDSKKKEIISNIPTQILFDSFSVLWENSFHSLAINQKIGIIGYLSAGKTSIFSLIVDPNFDVGTVIRTNGMQAYTYGNKNFIEIGGQETFILNLIPENANFFRKLILIIDDEIEKNANLLNKILDSLQEVKTVKIGMIIHNKIDLIPFRQVAENLNKIKDIFQQFISPDLISVIVSCKPNYKQLIEYLKFKLDDFIFDLQDIN